MLPSQSSNRGPEGRTMTAVSDIQQPALETPVGEAIHRSRARVQRRLFVAFLIGLALSLMLAPAALVAWDLSYEGRVLPGVRVGATDLSGLDRAGATAALEQAYSGYGEGQVLISTIAGDVAVDYSARSHDAPMSVRSSMPLSRPAVTGASSSAPWARSGSRCAARRSNPPSCSTRPRCARRSRRADSARSAPRRCRDRDGPTRRPGAPLASGLDFDVPTVQSSAVALVGSTTPRRRSRSRPPRSRRA